jgi:hypothetical protein
MKTTTRPKSEKFIVQPGDWLSRSLSGESDIHMEAKTPGSI